MGGESVYGGDEEDIDVSEHCQSFPSLANSEQSGIIDIDEIQNHGNIPQLHMFHVPADFARRQCCRYHQVEAEWHPHRWGELLPRWTKMLVANSTFQTLIGTTTKRLLKIKGFSEIKVEKIKDASRKLSVSCSHAITSESSPTL